MFGRPIEEPRRAGFRPAFRHPKKPNHITTVTVESKGNRRKRCF
jgi:hypothetical protein